MIERVARALYEEDDPWSKAFPWPNLSEVQAGVDTYRRYARSAIEAMRDLNPLELYPGVHAYIEDESTCRPAAFRAGWSAVIDAALSKAQLNGAEQ